MLFQDMDEFKPINDNHGHDAGDALLVETARRIASCVREVDTVARFGGDEFVVMLGELELDKAKSTAEAAMVVEKLRAILDKPYVVKLRQENDPEARRTAVHGEYRRGYVPRS